MKFLGTIVFISILCSSCRGQTQVMDSAKVSFVIKSQAETMAQLLLKKDFNGFVKFVYPKIAELAGGEAEMKVLLQEEIQKMESSGFTFLSISIDEPSKIIIHRNELQCTIPQILEMQVPNGRLITKSTLIAISVNEGKNWYFIDASNKDIEVLKKMLPNLSTDILIPEKQQPVFYKD